MSQSLASLPSYMSRNKRSLAFNRRFDVEDLIIHLQSRELPKVNYRMDQFNFQIGRYPINLKSKRRERVFQL